MKSKIDSLKHVTVLLLLSFVFSIVFMCTSYASETVIYDDYQFTVNKWPGYNAERVWLDKYLGTDTTVKLPNYIFYNGVVREVNSVSDEAFKDNDAIEKVIIPENYSYIGNSAFKGCDNLEEIIIGDCIYWFDRKTFYVGDDAFSNCPKLKKYVIGWDILGESEEIQFGDSDDKSIGIGQYVTDGVYDIYDDVTIYVTPGSAIEEYITGINSTSHTGNSITISDIGSMAEEVQYVYAVPESEALKTRENTRGNITNKYDGSTGVLSISGNGRISDDGGEYWEETQGDYIPRELVTKIIVDEGLTGGYSGALAEYYNVIEISLSDTFVNLGTECFRNCRQLKSIKLPEGIKHLESGAFTNCFKLQKVILPESLTTIDEYSFDGCKTLDSISIPDNVTTIHEGAFRGCSSLISIDIPLKVKTIENITFSGCKSLKTVSLGNGVKGIIDNAFDNCISLEHIIIPKGVSSIDDFAFYNCNPDLKIDTPTGSRAYDIAKYNDFEIVHDFGEWEVVKTATDNEAGSEKRVCKNCGEVEHKEIPALNPVTPEDPAALIDALSSRVYTLDIKLSAIEGKLTSYDTSIAEIKASVIKLDEAITKLEGAYKEADSALIEQLKQTKTNLENLEVEIKAAKQEIVDYKTSCENADAEIKESIGATDTKVSDIEKAVEEIKDKASQSEKNVSGIEDKVKNIQDQITELTKSYTETVAAKEALEKELASYKEQFFDADKYRVPTPTTLRKLKAGKKKIIVTWNKQTEHTNGYDIQYSLKKNFSVSVKTKTIKKNTTTKLTLKKLKAKKKYYVRIRTYKTIDGKKYYSDWSKKKAVKTK